MRVRTNKKDGFRIADRLIPVNALYINEHLLNAYVCDFALYVGRKTDNMYIKGFYLDNGVWYNAVFFETGTIFINGTRFGGGRYPEIFSDFTRKFPGANKAHGSKLAGMDTMKPASVRSRVGDITPFHGTAYSLKKQNADNADRWTFGGKPTSCGTDTACYAATGKVDRTVKKPAIKDFSKEKPNYSGSSRLVHNDDGTYSVKSPSWFTAPAVPGFKIK